MSTRRIDFPAMALLFRQLAAAQRRHLPLQEVAGVFTQDRSAPVATGAQPLRLLSGLARGAALSEAMREAQPAFAEDTVRWVAWSEQQGTLADTLDSLADDFERQQRATTALGVALIWPACVAAAIVGVFVLMSIFVIPAFGEAYDSLGADLPALTRHLFISSRIVSAWWWLWLPALLLVMGLALAGKMPPRVRAWGHAAAGALGFVARLRQASFVARLLGLLQRHHADRQGLAAALGHLATTTATPRLAGAARQLQAAVPAAEPLSQVLAAQPALPPRVSLFVRLGEKIGDLSAPLAQLGDGAEQEHAVALARFERGAILLLYLLLGLGVGTLVLGIYLPIFKLGSII